MKRSLWTGFLVAAVLAVAAAGTAGASRQASGLKVRWDIASFDFAKNPVAVSAGGVATSRASDGSKIVLTGSGTFGGAAADLGGGRRTASDPKGASGGTGTHTGRSLISFYGAAGTFGDPTGKLTLGDQIGNAADARAGLVVLGISYSDGSQGVLVVGSRLQGSPASSFAGITATKGSVAYWNREAPTGKRNADRTIFHVVP